MRLKLNFIAFFILLAILSGCKKETVYAYDVNNVDVSQPGAVKPNLKSDLEFISIAYTDLYGTVIPPDKLNDLVIAYASFGDKRLIIDMVILNFLNDPSVVIPSKSDMDANLDLFVENSFKKFYIREPGEYEKWFVKNLIQSDATITPELVYYGFMTSDEYRYY